MTDPVEPIPATLDALITLFGAVTVPDVELQVSDGGPLLEEANYVAVGYSDAEDVPAVDVTDQTADAGNGQDLESFDIANQVSAATGEETLSAARTRVFVIFRALRAAIAADPRLGRVVARARITEYHLVQQVGDGEAAAATINFTIRAEVWRRP